MSPRQKKVLKIVGFVALGLVVFVFALARTFPYDRLEDKLVEALGEKYDVTVGDISPGFFPGKVIIESLTLKTRPEKPTEKPSVIFLEEVTIDIGLLALIGGKVDVDIVATVPGGELKINVVESKKGRRIKIHTAGMALGTLPWVHEAVGLPMAGGLDADAEIWLPGRKWKDAEGSVKISCNSCTVGDGKAKLSLTPPKAKSSTRRARSKNAVIFASQGIKVPKLQLGVARIEVEIKKGLGTIKTFEAKSRDGWLRVDGELKFSDPVGKSKVPGCLRFQLSDSLKDREKDFGNIEFMLSERSRQDDGSYAIPTKGTLSALRPNVRKRCKDAKGTQSTPRTSTRPTISLPKAKDPAAKDAGTAKVEPTEMTRPERGISGPSLSTELLRDGARKVRGGDDVTPPKSDDDAKDAKDAKDGEDGDEDGEVEGEGEGEEGGGEGEGADDGAAGDDDDEGDAEQ